jgi:HAD superfamily hydrolase (TIGR01509 family)
MRELEAVVFDMDGVLFDTEYLGAKAWEKAAKHYNLKDIRPVLNQCIGRSEAAIVKVFGTYYGDKLDFYIFRDLVEKFLGEEIATCGLPIKKGVINLLQHLKENQCKLAVASSSNYEKIIKFLDLTHIRHYFDEIVSGDKVQHSKPHPEIYDVACQKLGVSPQKSLCIEDSINGVKSGAAAGLRVIMVPDLLKPTPEILPMIEKICVDLDEVKTYIG